MVTSATSVNCVSIKNMFAILSMRIYVAEASRILASVAISDKSGFAKQMIAADKTR